MLRRFEHSARPDRPGADAAAAAGLVRFYWHYIRQVRGLAVSLYIFGGLIAILDTMIPTFIGRLVDWYRRMRRTRWSRDCWPQLFWHGGRDRTGAPAGATSHIPSSSTR